MKGIYVLIIQINKSICQKIGKLGKITFTSGLYAYIGSSQNNLELRVKRHQRKEKRLFWHIDYLLDNDSAKIIRVYYNKHKKIEECRIASLLGENSETIAGFGCSDCSCASHLFRLGSLKCIETSMEPLNLV